FPIRPLPPATIARKLPALRSNSSEASLLRICSASRDQSNVLRWEFLASSDWQWQTSVILSPSSPLQLMQRWATQQPDLLLCGAEQRDSDNASERRWLVRPLASFSRHSSMPACFTKTRTITAVLTRALVRGCGALSPMQ